MATKRFPVKTSLITDLPADKQEWLKNLKPPPVETKTNYTLQKKNSRGKK